MPWSKTTLLRLTVPLAAAVTAFALAAPAAHADGYIETGTDDPVAAAPPVSAPTSAHCTVPLAKGFLSNAPDGSPQNYTGTLTPPANCPGPWAKVVLTSTTSVSGRQYDRSGSLQIGGATVWFGTTQEPGGATPTTFSFSKDITRYSALLRTPQPFSGGIGNYVTDVYTGNYSQTVSITYYRADRRNPSPRVPDVVRGVPIDDLTPGTPTQTATLTDLPRNITGADLELTLKGNGCDEQWFTAVPDEVAAKFPGDGLCAHNPYREAQVGLDGAAAGAVGTYPHIYSGGIVPTLWRPVLAIDTLDLRPENLDLTPFAGRMVDGASHQLSVAISPIGDTWNVQATLFLYTDHHRAQISGALTTDSVTTPTLHTTTSDVDGGAKYSVSAQRHDVTAGYMDTSAGRVYSRVMGERSYRNSGQVTDHGLVQSISQTDRIAQSSISTLRGRVIAGTTLAESYPITVDYSAASYVDDQNFSLEGTVTMGQNVFSAGFDGSRHTVRAYLESVTSHGILARAAGVTSQSDGHSTTSFAGTDDRGGLYLHHITTNHGRVITDQLF